MPTPSANDAPAQHTPGPWTAHDGWQFGGKPAAHPKWCEVTGGSLEAGKNISITGHFGFANARLIAAAPEMLESLHGAKAFLALFINDTSKPTSLIVPEGMDPNDFTAAWDEANTAVTAAIAKAEG